MNVISIPLLDAKRLASALLPHVSKDAVTPVLNNVVIRSGSEGGVFAYASDRYTVGRYDLTNIIEAAGVNAYIPRHVLAAVATLGKATLPRDLDQYQIEFEELKSPSKFTYFSATAVWHREGEMDDTHWMRRWDTFSPIRDGYVNFPPVEKFFDEFLPGETSRILLGPEQVEKFTGYAKMMSTSIRVTLARSEENVGRPKPHLVEIGPRFKGMIQPHIFGIGTEFGTDLAAVNEAAAVAKAAAEETPAQEVSESE